MIQSILILILMVCSIVLEASSVSEGVDLKINLFCEKRGGLGRDQLILKEALNALGCQVNCYEKGNGSHLDAADINIYCETLYPKSFYAAPLNWFIPNPEWYLQDMTLLDSIDLILCRTHEVERIFSSLNKKTFYLGFSSEDHLDDSIKKDYNSCLHLAGTSWQKGTFPLLEAWVRHPEFPQLTIVKFPEGGRKVPQNVTWTNYWLPETDLQILQNQSGIHLCLSETEGFGHYIMEAMGVGAVVITTDAPPMNEFITDSRCLVPYSLWEKDRLGTNYYVDVKKIEAKVQKVLQLPVEELIEIGGQNRKRYLQITKKFRENLQSLLMQAARRGRNFKGGFFEKNAPFFPPV